MKVKIPFKGLHCASCRGKIEKEILKLASIEKIEIHMIDSCFYIDYKNSTEETIKAQVKKIVKSIEPETQILENFTEKKGINWPYIIALVLYLGIVIILPKQSGYVVALVGYLVIGRKIFSKAIMGFSRGDFFNENSLMTIATLGAFYLGSYEEAVGIMLFYTIGESFQGHAVEQSQSAIKALLNFQKPVAHKKITESKIETIDANLVNVGDVLLVKKGETIPVDARILSKKAVLDNSSLTGESKPVTVKQGGEILSGSINIGDSFEIEVLKSFGNSTLSKIKKVLEEAFNKKSKTDEFITKFARIYTPTVLVLTLFIIAVPTIVFHQAFDTWLYRGMILLIISCPCALVLSIPLTFFAAIGRASREGILIKNATMLELVTKVQTVMFDKTGTLTYGQFDVKNIKCSSRITKYQAIEIIVALEQFSTHPISLAIQRYASEMKLTSIKVEEVHEIEGYGITGKIDDKTWYIGSRRFLEKKSLHITQSDECHLEKDYGDGTLYLFDDAYGYAEIIVEDSVKYGAKAVIATLNQRVKTVMVSGDSEKIATDISKRLDMSKCYFEVLPIEKNSLVTQYKLKGKTMFVGEGINDAVAIKTADIGVSMGQLGSDIAIEASDIVITKDEIEKITTLFSLSNATLCIAWQNIFLALGIKIAIVILTFFGLSNMWEALFADVGVTLITVFNATRILYKKL